MQLSVVFRGMEPSVAIEQYAAKYLEKFKKYCGQENPDTIFVQIILEGNHNHKMMMVEVNIKTNHFNSQVKREGHDMYSLIDEAMHVMERELQQEKQKRVDDIRQRKKCC